MSNNWHTLLNYCLSLRYITRFARYTYYGMITRINLVARITQDSYTFWGRMRNLRSIRFATFQTLLLVSRVSRVVCFMPWNHFLYNWASVSPTTQHSTNLSLLPLATTFWSLHICSCPLSILALAGKYHVSLQPSTQKTQKRVESLAFKMEIWGSYL